MISASVRVTPFDRKRSPGLKSSKYRSIAIPCAGGLGCVALYVALYGRRIRTHDFHSLREFLQILEARRPRGIAPQRLADGLRELRRLRRFHADERDALLAVLEPDLDAIGGVRVDHDPVVLPHAADGGQPVRVRARA